MLKSLTKLMLSLMFLAMVLTTSVGCSNQNTPEAVTLRYLTAFHGNQPGLAYDDLSRSDKETKSRKEYIEESNDNPFFGYMAGRVSFEIEAVNLSGNEATVGVAMTAPDFSSLMGELFSTVMSSAFDEEQSDEESNAAFSDVLEKADLNDLPTVTGHEEFQLKFEDETWKIYLGWKKQADELAQAQKVESLVAQADAHRSNNKLDEALKIYNEAMSVDSESVEALQGFKETRQEIDTLLEHNAYLPKIELYDFEAKYFDSWLDSRVPGIRFKLRNTGDRILNKVEVTVYFKNSNGDIIAEEDYHPVLVSEYSYGDNKPLKAGYIWQMEKDSFYKAEKVPSEWSEGKAIAKITEIEFAQ